jgi:hypothetical protein
MAVLLRIILLIGNASLLVFFVTMISEYHTTFYWWVYGPLIFLALNFVYLLLGPNRPKWRVFSLIGLWLDAQENDLRKRAGQDK